LTIESANLALIISGSAMEMINEYKSTAAFYANQLMKIASVCKAVLACRVSPAQKQNVVEFVRKANPKAVTLAIGDGANDVNMITAAHVGIGLRGVEGQQVNYLLLILP
jgi:phospholipid-transporting ATPase